MLLAKLFQTLSTILHRSYLIELNAVLFCLFKSKLYLGFEGRPSAAICPPEQDKLILRALLLSDSSLFGHSLAIFLIHRVSTASTDALVSLASPSVLLLAHCALKEGWVDL